MSIVHRLSLQTGTQDGQAIICRPRKQQQPPSDPPFESIYIRQPTSKSSDLQPTQSLSSTSIPYRKSPPSPCQSGYFLKCCDNFFPFALRLEQLLAAGAVSSASRILRFAKHANTSRIGKYTLRQSTHKSAQHGSECRSFLRLSEQF